MDTSMRGSRMFRGGGGSAVIWVCPGGGGGVRSIFLVILKYNFKKFEFCRRGGLDPLTPSLLDLRMTYLYVHTSFYWERKRHQTELVNLIENWAMVMCPSCNQERTNSEADIFGLKLIWGPCGVQWNFKEQLNRSR